MIISAADNLKEKLLRVGSVLIALGIPSVFDEVAAGLALRLGLMSLGKKVGVVCDVPMVVAFNQLVGVDKIKTEIGGENLVIVFSKVASESIERVSYDMDAETGRLKLVVYPKLGRMVPGRSQVSFEREGASGELVIALGQNWGKLEEKMEKSGKDRLICIGTSVGRSGDFGLIVEDKKKSSVSEVVADVLSVLGIKWDADLATNLFLGIEAGSRSFTSGLVSAETFKLASELLLSGARRAGLPDVRGETKSDWMTPKVYKGGGMLV